MSTTYTPPPSTTVVEQHDPAQDARAFRRALGQFATGVTVITTSDGSEHVGMAVNSFAAVSLDPPLISWSIRNESQRREAFVNNGHFAVSVLAEDQVDTASLFGRPQENQFERVAWTMGTLGDRLLDHAIAHFECTLEGVHEGGDHLILIGRVKRCSRLAGAPLLFSQGSYGVGAPHPQIDLTSASPSSRPSPDADDRSPLFMSLLKSTEQRMSALFDEYRDRLGIDVAGSRVVNLLDVAPARTADLAEQALLGEAAVEDVLRDFTRRGWVAESSGVYTLTKSGRRVRADLLRSAKEFTAARLEGVDPADLEVARRVLVHLLTQ